MKKSMAGDVWLLTSAVHKAIRRGETDRAISAATSLLQQDKRKLWSRLKTVATEDLGVASPSVTAAVLNNTDYNEPANLLRLMCSATKTRIADLVFIQAERSKELKLLRLEFSKATDASLTKTAHDINQPLVKRCLALWYLAGTQRYRSDHIPPRYGDLNKAIEVINELKGDKELFKACVASLKSSSHPLPLFTPLIHQTTNKLPFSVRMNDIPLCPEVHGLPHYAADIFTRIGKSCFGELKKIIPELQKFPQKQIALAYFYIEGKQLDKEMFWPELEDLQKAGELTDMESVGISEADYMRFKEILLNRAETLAEIRHDKLSYYLRAAA